MSNIIWLDWQQSGHWGIDHTLIIKYCGIFHWSVLNFLVQWRIANRQLDIMSQTAFHRRALSNANPYISSTYCVSRSWITVEQLDWYVSHDLAFNFDRNLELQHPAADRFCVHHVRESPEMCPVYQRWGRQTIINISPLWLKLIW